VSARVARGAVAGKLACPRSRHSVRWHPRLLWWIRPCRP